MLHMIVIETQVLWGEALCGTTKQNRCNMHGSQLRGAFSLATTTKMVYGSIWYIDADEEHVCNEATIKAMLRVGHYIAQSQVLWGEALCRRCVDLLL